MRFRGRRLSVVALFGILVALGAAQVVQSAEAIHRTAWTKATSISAKRQLNGDIVVEAVFMSSDRHCLEVGRWKKGRPGKLRGADAVPYGPGGIYGPSNQDDLRPYKLEAARYVNGPWTWRWRAVWPANFVVHHESGRTFTISEATKISGAAASPPLQPEWQYKEAGKTYVVDCHGPGSHISIGVYKKGIEGDGPVHQGPPSGR